MLFFSNLDLNDLRAVIHYGIHFGVPLAIALIWKGRTKEAVKVFAIFLLGMLIDLDHLFATPIFASNRCSIGYHPLHTGYATLLYIASLAFSKTRLLGIGIMIHLLADVADCLLLKCWGS